MIFTYAKTFSAPVLAAPVVMKVTKADASTAVKALYNNLEANGQEKVLGELPGNPLNNTLVTLKLVVKDCLKVDNVDGAKLARKACGRRRNYTFLTEIK